MFASVDYNNHKLYQLKKESYTDFWGAIFLYTCIVRV